MTATEYTRYQDIPETTADLEWADLVTIDLSQFDEPGGKKKLASQLKHAISTVGFFYVINFGLSEEEVDDQFARAKDIFDLPGEAKQKYRVDPTKQGFFGWKPRGSRKQQHGLVDSLELYDDPKWNDFYKERLRPQPLVDDAEKTEKFQRHLASYVLRRLLILSAIIMELDDEEALWKLHDYESQSQCHLRYMLYHPRTPDELEIMKQHNIEQNVYGHTDFGTFTLLMRQPVAALQVRPYGEKKWKWVKPLKESITVNVADTLSFLTGGYLESSIHRVVLPPEDQRDIPRYGVIYFAGPDDSTLLQAVKSPLLERGQIEGDNNRALPPVGVTAGEWVRIRFGSIDANYANNKDNKVVVKNVEVPSYA
ncbi:2OG-Fe(II) oxygenase superfamily protein [Eremomyces bilateralis CBS 781.70]|uniref:2OG-Fe(II) oxygenase superfamily protein n=1 Tax=Eremomyces bilateralis CBS 781.70 TaxID=1392243 RepID=A0A6G1GGA6_9PEZI|nr:2OG-Fe(II) oxygenase superfamily protein [Eremomyces bilateralis CBS 781.70]KAF1817083.1 2OG-Fe(II) oxygenase superfamily protein [Eremomyces bilateralis CBS 781.70]